MHAVEWPVCGYTDHPRRVQAVSVPVHANVHVVRATEWCSAAHIAVVSSGVIAVVVSRHGVVGIAHNAPQTVVQVLHPGVRDHTAPLFCIVENLIDAEADGVYVCVVEMCSYVMIHGPEESRALPELLRAAPDHAASGARLFASIRAISKPRLREHV